ncbi:MAG: hypothetical protein AB7L65_01610 [Hyphomonadaceae bacterium]
MRDEHFPDCDEEPATAGQRFLLVDDADGRFIIDAVTGVVSLAHEDLIERERNVTHTVRIRVLERNGAAYELSLRLKITGMVPRVAGDDFFSAPGEGAPHAVPSPQPAPFSEQRWLHYAAFAARQAQHRKRARFAAPYGAALGAPSPAALALSAKAELSLRAAPFPSMPDGWLSEP